MTKQTTPWLDLARPATLADPSLAAFGGVTPEKWEGLTIGPRLADGSYLVLAGTDNDFSVSQNPSATQFDVYFKAASGTANRIRCDIGTLDNCIVIGSDGVAGAAVPAGFDFSATR